jgi:hypothetical protein
MGLFGVGQNGTGNDSSSETDAAKRVRAINTQETQEKNLKEFMKLNTKQERKLSKKQKNQALDISPNIKRSRRTFN